MTRTVKLELTASVSGLQAGLRTAQRATANFAKDLDSFQKKHEQSLDTIGGAAGKAGLAAAAGLAMVGKAAIDWESAWTGVKKTVDGTPQQLGKVEDGLRNLAKTLPSTHEEIAGVAEAAGQLGVATNDIVGFTKTMIDLGETTNLTAEDAATNIAQISNVMGTMKREGTDGVERFGAALVALGNDGASTEAEILSMSQRIAGAGATIGASESDVLALSNTLASMGVNAELGGGVMTRVLLKMRTAADEGGESLESFAKVAGVSADEFATKFREAPMEALDLVAQGISRVNSEGGNVTATLKDMGIKGTEETQVMLQLANAGDLLADSLTLGNQAWQDNTALLAEAEQRYNTTEAKISIAWNKIKDAAIEAGGAILPMVANIADAIGGLADWFGDLPGPIQKFLTVLGGVGAAAGLGTAGLIAVSRQVSQLSEAFGTIYGSGGRAQGAIKGVGRALGGITAVGAGIIASKLAIEAINQAAREGQPDLEEYFNLLATGGSTSAVPELDFGGGGRAVETYRKQHEELAGLSDEAVRAARAIEQMGKLNSPVGWLEDMNVGHLADATNEAKRFQDAMGATARLFEMGEVSKGQEALQGFADKLSLSDERVAQLINNVPQLKSALMGLATEQGIQIDPNDELGLVDLALGRIKTSAPAASGGVDQAKASLEAMGVAADGTVDELDKMLESLLALSTGTLSTRAAERQFQESIDAVTESIKTNGKSLDETKEKGRANQAVLDQVASSGLAVATSMAEAKDSQGNYVNSQADVQKSLQSTYDATVKSAEAFTGNKKEAEALARELLGIPKGVSVETWMDTFARDTAEQTTAAIEAMPGYKVVQIAVTEDGTAGSVQSKINEVTGKTEYVFVSDDGTVQTVQAAIVSIDGKNVPVYVTDDGTVVGTQGQINGIKGKNVTVTATAETAGAEAQLNWVARPRTSSIRQQITKEITSIDNGPVTGQFGGPRRANGGSVFGPGTETSDSIPAWLSTNEHVLSAREVRGLGGHGSVERLRALARNGQAPAFATGGRVGWSQGKDKSLSAAAKIATAERKQAERDLKEAEKALSSADKAAQKASRRSADTKGGKKNAAAKTSAKAAARAAADAKKEAAANVKSAKKAVDRLKKAEDAAKDRFSDSRARTGRLSEATFALQRDMKRGSITDAFTSGSGMSVVDRLFEQSNNKDLSTGARKQMRSLAYKLESELLRLEKRSDKLAESFDKAKSKRDDLLSVRNSVASGLQGETSLSGLISEHQATRYGKVTTAGMVQLGRAKVAKLKAFEQKLRQLGAKGVSGVLVQEIAEMGVEAGTEAANILLASPANDLKALNQVYADVEKYSRWSGDRVTDALSGGMYKSGLHAANGLVAGLESQQKQVEDAFYKLGKSAETSFKKSLGIKSPSRNAMGWMSDVVDGSVIGIAKNTGKLEKAMLGLGQAGENAFSMQAALSVPPSFEVARFAQAQAAPPQFTVIVENPWTGEQVEAKVRAVADQSVAAGQRAVAAGVRNSRG
ncbi:phage tail tape measure protein [Glutamicibacter soli]|uniref:phage tail tape measure protein n=1 Tax=Glutamicibacter soli TaxID=453836 RepID=UPI003FCFCA8A